MSAIIQPFLAINVSSVGGKKSRETSNNMRSEMKEDNEVWSISETGAAVCVKGKRVVCLIPKCSMYMSTKEEKQWHEDALSICERHNEKVHCQKEVEK